MEQKNISTFSRFSHQKYQRPTVSLSVKDFTHFTIVCFRSKNEEIFLFGYAFRNLFEKCIVLKTEKKFDFLLLG